ncbi:ABC transporter permease [Microlunatus parietis]|uniref:ABC-2 type transport system permease protein n=1 Tax=Microlunatus parietis TaxID=682979 RepID=A0A7Y9IFE1_9ACTN|nr:ABC transporter permease [Microlunatus parietis]NYE75199.1 ABC-2 type transport system permease protein [Microlunatus parietis]
MSAAEAVQGERAEQLEAGGRFRLPGRLLGSELRLIFTRRRNIAGMAVLAAVPILLAVSVKVWGGDGGGPDFISSITQSGLFVALAALAIELPLFLPLAVATIAGDSIAGEANLGTLRYLLTVPVGRTRLLLIKYASIVIFALAATLLVAAVGVLIGVILFGTGPMITFSGTQLGFAAGLGRLLIIIGYLAAGFAALGAIGLFVSVLTEQPIAATVATVLINVVMFVCDTIPQLDWLHPWLLTHWWTAFGDLLRDPMAFDSVGRGLLTAAGYALVFWLAAWARFSGKDVSS